MTIRGVSHLTFIVRDLDRTARLLSVGLGAEEVYDSKAKNFSLAREKFFLLGGVWLAFMEGEPTERTYRHVAFEVAEEELPNFEVRLRELDVEIEAPRSRVEGDGLSLYFMTTITTCLSYILARLNNGFPDMRNEFSK